MQVAVRVVPPAAEGIIQYEGSQLDNHGDLEEPAPFPPLLAISSNVLQVGLLVMDSPICVQAIIPSLPM